MWNNIKISKEDRDKKKRRRRKKRKEKSDSRINGTAKKIETHEGVKKKNLKEKQDGVV